MQGLKSTLLTFVQSVNHHISKSILPLGIKEMYSVRDTYV